MPEAPTDESPTISVVMPVLDGARLLPESLPPLLDLLGDGLLEVVVVDDGSADGSAAIAEDLGARVIRRERRAGPSAARNRGAERARGDILFFVDADVVIQPDAVSQLVEGFSAPGVVAVFGSYDDAPPERNFASLYMNLRHHHVHSAKPGEVTTFWAGCGAVRRDAFVAAGGFDAERYAHPSIEDIELGYRLTDAGGRILIRPELRCKHLKHWTWWNVVHTDVMRRGLPWGRLLAARPRSATELNARRSEQAAAGVAWGFALALLLSVAGWAPVWLPAALLAVAAFTNRALLSTFRRRGGLGMALGGLLQHQLYYLYATLCVVYTRLEALTRNR